MTDGGRQDLYRLIRVIGACLFFVAITAPGLAAPTRTLTLFLLASVFSLAAVYELSVREAPQRWMLYSALIIFAVTGIVAAALTHMFPVRPEAQGPLIAAGDPAPAGDCGGRAASTGLVMMFGKDRVVGEGPGPFTPLRIGSCPALTIRRVAGGLSIDAFGYDSGDDVVYRIQNNEFHMVLRGFDKASRPDANTLIVSDDQGRETLFVRYLNRNAVKIRGTFRCGDTDPVVVGEDAVTIGGRAVAGRSCAIVKAGTPYGIAYSSHAP